MRKVFGLIGLTLIVGFFVVVGILDFKNAVKDLRSERDNLKAELEAEHKAVKAATAARDRCQQARVDLIIERDELKESREYWRSLAGRQAKQLSAERAANRRPVVLDAWDEATRQYYRVSLGWDQDRRIPRRIGEALQPSVLAIRVRRQ